MKPVFLTALIVFILSLSFLANKDFPNGLFSLKELGFYVLILIACCCTAFLLLCNNIRSIHFNHIDALVFFFLVAMPLSQFILLDIKTDFVAISIGVFFIYLMLTLIANGILGLKISLYVSWIIFVILLTQIILSVLQFTDIIPPYHHASRISGMFFNPGPFAIYMASLSIFFLPLVVFFWKKKKRSIILILSATIISSLLILVELNSRSSWIGFVFGMLYVFFFNTVLYKKNTWFGNRKKIVPILLLSSAILIPLVGYWFYQIRPDSATGRILIWKSALALIQEYPFYGVGTGNFVAFYPKFQAFVLQNNSNLIAYGNLAGETEYAFNDILHVFGETGMIGGVIYITTIFCLLHQMYYYLKRKKYSDYVFSVIVGLSASLIVIIAAGLTAYPNQMLPIKVWFWTIIALIGILSRGRSEKNEMYNLYKWKAGKVVSLFICLVGLFYGYIAVKKLNGYLSWENSKNQLAFSPQLLSYIPYLNSEGDFLNEIGNYYLNKKHYEKAGIYFRESTTCKFDKSYYYDLGEALEKQGKFSEAISVYKLIEDAIPHLVKPRYLQAKLYYLIGDVINFEIKAAEVLELNPKIYNPSIEMMKREISFLLRNVESNQIK